MKNKNVRNKILSVLLVVIMIFSSIYPIASVVAHAADYYGKAVIINGEISPSVDSSNNYTFSNSDVLTLEWMEFGNGHDEGWWLGLKITAPESMSADELEFAKFTVNSGEPKSFWENKNSADGAQEHYITNWIEITESKLTSKDGIEVEYTFNWNSNDDTNVQVFKVSLDESKVVLVKNGFISYPQASKFAAVDSSDLIVSGSETENVTATNGSVKSFVWKEANPEKGITADGWWTSVTVSAPTGITASTLADATYKETGGEAKSFSDAAGSHSDLILWANIDEKKVEDNETISSSWDFDWDNDGVFEQKVSVTLDCKNIILIKDDKQVYPLYTINFTAGKNGSIEITNPDSLIGEDEVTVQKDQVIRYEAYADSGYVIGSIKYNNNPIEIADELEIYKGKITVAEDAEINASFELKNYDIVYHTPIGTAPENATYTIKDAEYKLATPKSVDGYEFVRWAYADGNLVSYENIIENSTIDGGEVRSDLELYAIWAVDAEITVEGAESGKWVNGDERILTITSKLSNGIYTYTYGENSSSTEGAVTIAASNEVTTVTYDVTYVTLKDGDINYLYSVNADEFVLKRDGVSPSFKVTYTTKVSQLILKTLSFGFYKPDVLVKVEVTEKGSGVDYFVINAVANGPELATEKELPENLKIYTSESPEKYNSDDSAITIEKITGSSVEFTISSNLRATFDYAVADKVGNSSEGKGAEYNGENDIIITDNISPEISVEYTWTGEGSPTLADKDNNDVSAIEDAEKIYHNGGINIKFTVNDINFFEGEELADGEERYAHAINILVNKTVNGETTFEEYLPHKDAKKSNANATASVLEWTETDDGVYVADVKLEDEGEYVIEISYSDFSGNDAVIDDNISDNDVIEYRSKDLIIDKTAPVIYKATYICDTDILPGDNYYSDNVTAEIRIAEKNFRASEISADITAKDINGNDITDTSIINYIKSILIDDDTWTSSNDKKEHVATFELPGDAVYTFDISYTDLANNDAADYVADEFAVDTTAPVDAMITYESFTESIILKALTFGFYKDDVKVTLSAKDETTAIKRFEFTIQTNEDYASATNISFPEKIIVDSNSKVYVVSGEGADAVEVTPDNAGVLLKDISVPIFVTDTEDKSVAQVEFTMPEEFSGRVNFVAANNAEHVYDHDTDTDEIDEHEADKNIVIDSISPEVTVEYIHGIDTEFVQEIAGEEYSNLYYNGAVKAKIIVDEANFFEGKINEKDDTVIHNVKIILSKTDNDGNVVEREFKPADSAMISDLEYFTDFNWTLNDDGKYEMEIDLTEDADYQLHVEYTDYSENDAKITEDGENSIERAYTSDFITVDTKAPEISIVYDKTVDDAVNKIEGRAYFDVYRQATITVTEHNFRPSDFVVTLIAKNYAGADTAVSLVESIKTQIASIENWTKTDNTYTTTICYTEDANYDFDIEYKDLAQNSIADYANDVFTIDHKDPYAVKVTYKEKVIDRIISGITFGYYNTNVEVTVTAYDATSGVLSFDYEGILAENVSEINKKVAKSAIENAEVTHVEGTKKSVASFTIPKKALNSKNSFNGTVTVTAYDRTNHSAVVVDKERLIVDNIKPTGQLKFSNPVDLVDNVTYYDGPITAMISINEANFYARDVEVYIDEDMTKRVSIPESAWEKNGDVYSTSFEISEEGEYNVVVKYSDRSGNEMETIVSNKLIVDTTVPRIEIHNIGQRSANNDEVIGFVISVIDKNIGAEVIAPTCFAVVRVDTGDVSEYKFTQNAIRLGNASHSINSSGESVYTYTVNNLETDGYYSLRCSASDYAGHTISNMSITDSNVSSDALNFSVNRLGSTFWISSTYTTKDSDKTYTDSINGKYINGDVKIELHEINVDEVNHDVSSDKQTVFTLNDGSTASDIILEEGKNYVKNTNAAQNSGGWFESIYTLDEENFDHDGNYSISILTYDRASNSNLNTKATEGTVEFTVDRTNPVISSNIESNARIKDSEYTVEFKVNEANLSTDKKDIVVTYEGNEVEYESIGNNEYKFTIRQGTKQEISIKVTDLANNVSEEYVVENITVSTNALVLFFANTQLVLTVVAGIVLAIAIIFVLLFLKKRKRNEDE